MGMMRLWLFGALVLGWGGGCLPCPALLSAPVTLTLTLSRRAGEGIPLPPLPSILGFPLSGDGVEWLFAGWGVFVFAKGASPLHPPLTSLRLFAPPYVRRRGRGVPSRF